MEKVIILLILWVVSSIYFYGLGGRNEAKHILRMIEKEERLR